MKMKSLFLAAVLVASPGAPALAAMVDAPRVPPRGIEGPDVRSRTEPKGIEGPDLRAMVEPKGIEGPDVRVIRVAR